ncbi:hypothetical protein N5C36_19285 [Shewanella xiamenensis]|uniref:hypothetical protein n=1 Tax=Shewanella xiamenensis TaxID=332186 RepID=UPI00244D10B7|nr:hypothetical protein [Shewanella xiamenensis]MDH1316217.1 hypothetical protein [Shewanella xiamenensis]
MWPNLVDHYKEQSAQVAEFNGLLSAVNDARTEIEAAKSTLANLATEQGEFVTKNSNKFEEFESRLTSLNELIGQIKDAQLKLRSEMADLKFVTPDQFEQGCAAIDCYIAKQFAELTSKLETTAESQTRAISALRTIVVLGILVLAGGIGFLAKVY